MKWNWLVQIGILGLATSCFSVIAIECNTVDECIALIPETEGKARGIGEVEDAVRTKLQSFGRDALLPLAELTSEDNSNRRLVADSLIAEIKDLSESDFDVVKRVVENNIALNGGGGWSYGALGYVGGDEAGAYLVSELKRVQSASNQIGTAFNRLGAEGIPYLIEGLQCFDSCSEGDFRGFREIFDHYQHRAKISNDTYAAQLLNIATNDKLSIHARQTALSVIGYMTDNTEVANQIHQYAEEHIEFTNSALMSLLNMKSPLGAKLLVRRLSFEESEPSLFYSNLLVFRDLSEMGQAANSVGGDVLPYLNSPSWEDRIHSALTLGYIGYRQAIPDLLKLLSNEADWQQSYAGIKALRLLSDPSTIPRIEKVANTHWYKPLREYAREVVISISEKRDYKPEQSPYNFVFDFLDYQQLREENHTCDITDYAMVAEPEDIKRYGDRETKLEPFQYKNPRCSDVDYQTYRKDFCASAESIVFPSLAVKFGKNWLTGDNRGEWGGELVAFEDEEVVETLLNENIEDVYVLGEYAYVITGLAHMSSNNGLIYRIEYSSTGYSIEPFYRLPGAPRTSWKISDDSILINTVSGAVVFGPSKGLEMANCSNKGS